MKVNNIAMLVDFTSIDDAKNFIAYKLNTLPRFLLMPDDFVFAPSAEVDYFVEDLLAMFRKSERLTWPDVRLDDRRELLKELRSIFVATNTSLEGASEKEASMLLLIMANRLVPVEEVWRNRRTIVEALDAELEGFASTMKATADQRSSFERVTAVPYIDFKLMLSELSATIGDGAVTTRGLAFIFDHLAFDDRFVFAVHDDVMKFNKFRKHDVFRPSEGWVCERTKELVRFVLLMDAEDTAFHGSIAKSEQHDGGEIVVKLQYKFSKRYNDTAVLLDQIVRALRLQQPFAQHDVRNKLLSGQCRYSSRRLHLFVFRDLIMNDPAFSALLIANDNIAVTRYVRCFFKLNKSAVNVSSAVNTSSNANMAFGQGYVRLYFRNRDYESDIPALFGKILAMYYEREAAVLEYYARFMTIPSLDDQTGVVVRQPLKRQRPEIFRAKFSRTCPHMPEIVEEVPDDPAASLQFPVGHPTLKPETYVCRHEKFTMPGLIENRTASKDDFPVVPCCYIKDQRNKRVFKDYYSGELMANLARGYSRDGRYALFSTMKTLPLHQMGVLPAPIAKLFMALTLLDDDDDGGDRFYARLGVQDGGLDAAVVRVLGLPSSKLKKGAGEHLDLYATLCRQEFFGESMADVAKRVRGFVDGKEPSSKRFVHLLEEVYDCGILLFDANDFVHSDYPYVSTKFRPRKHLVLLFVHPDGKTFEPIVHENPRPTTKSSRTSIAHSMTNEKGFAQQLFDVYQQLREYTDTHSGQVLPMIKPHFPIEAQRLNSCDQIQMLACKEGKESIAIMPFQSYPAMLVPLLRDDDGYRRATLNAILKFTKRYEIRLVGYVTNEERTRVREMHFTSKSVHGILLTDFLWHKPSIVTKPLDILERFKDVGERDIFARYFLVGKVLNFLKYHTKLLFQRHYPDAAPTNELVADLLRSKNFFFDVDEKNTNYLAMNENDYSERVKVHSKSMAAKLCYYLQREHVDGTLRTNPHYTEVFDTVMDYEHPFSFGVTTLRSVEGLRKYVDGPPMMLTVVREPLVDDGGKDYYVRVPKLSRFVYRARNYATMTEVSAATRPSTKLVAFQNADEFVTLIEGADDRIVLAYKIEGVPRYTLLVKTEL